MMNSKCTRDSKRELDKKSALSEVKKLNVSIVKPSNYQIDLSPKIPVKNTCQKKEKKCLSTAAGGSLEVPFRTNGAEQLNGKESGAQSTDYETAEYGVSKSIRTNDCSNRENSVTSAYRPSEVNGCMNTVQKVTDKNRRLQLLSSDHDNCQQRCFKSHIMIGKPALEAAHFCGQNHYYDRSEHAQQSQRTGTDRHLSSPSTGILDGRRQQICRNRREGNEGVLRTSAEETELIHAELYRLDRRKAKLVRHLNHRQRADEKVQQSHEQPQERGALKASEQLCMTEGRPNRTLATRCDRDPSRLVAMTDRLRSPYSPALHTDRNAACVRKHDHVERPYFPCPTVGRRELLIGHHQHRRSVTSQTPRSLSDTAEGFNCGCQRVKGRIGDTDNGYDKANEQHRFGQNDKAMTDHVVPMTMADLMPVENCKKRCASVGPTAEGNSRCKQLQVPERPRTMHRACMLRTTTTNDYATVRLPDCKQTSGDRIPLTPIKSLKQFKRQKELCNCDSVKYQEQD
jgi:hypothetical protein